MLSRGHPSIPGGGAGLGGAVHRSRRAKPELFAGRVIAARTPDERSGADGCSDEGRATVVVSARRLSAHEEEHAEKVEAARRAMVDGASVVSRRAASIVMLRREKCDATRGSV